MKKKFVLIIMVSAMTLMIMLNYKQSRMYTIGNDHEIEWNAYIEEQKV